MIASVREPSAPYTTRAVLAPRLTLASSWLLQGADTFWRATDDHEQRGADRRRGLSRQTGRIPRLDQRRTCVHRCGGEGDLHPEDGTVRRAQLPKMPGSIVPSSRASSPRWRWTMMGRAVSSDASCCVTTIPGHSKRTRPKSSSATSSTPRFTVRSRTYLGKAVPERRQVRPRPLWVGSKVLGRPDMDARYVQAGPDTPTGSKTTNRTRTRRRRRTSPSTDSPAGALFCVEPAFASGTGPW